LTLSQQIWELILDILIIFWIAYSYIAINTLIIFINKLNTLTLIYDTVIKNKKNNNLKIILKVQLFTSEQISNHKMLTPPKNWLSGQL
jgi:hypothetical protein